MVINTIGMVAQLCFVEEECFETLDMYYFNAEAIALNSTDNSTINKALVEHSFMFEDTGFATMVGLAVILGLLLNVMTIVILVTGRRNSKGIRVQLINLAIADCLWSAVGPMMFYHIRFEIPLPPNLFVCKTAGALAFLVVTASPLCNVAISIDRFVVVHFPMKVVNYRNHHKIMIAISVWVISLVVDMGAFFNAHLQELHGTVWCFCSPIRYNKPFSVEVFYLVSAVKYGVPAMIIVLMYSLIAVRLLRQESVGVRNDSTRRQDKSRRDKLVRSSVKVLCTDALFTLMTWLPFTAFQLISTNYVLNGTVDILDDVSTVTTYYRIQGALICALLTNCFSSPIIYFCVNDNFRDDTLALLARCGCKCFNKYLRRQSLYGSRGSSSGSRLTTKLSVSTTTSLNTLAQSSTTLASSVPD